MSLTEHDLDQVLVRIGDEIDRYRASRPPVHLTDATGHGREDRDAHRLRRGVLVAVAASVLAVAGVWGVASFNRRGGDDAVGVPSVPVEPDVLTPVVEPLLPDGFVVVRETASVPFVVTALGPDGVRLDVLVGLDEAEIARQQVGDTMVPAPAGEMTSNGSMVFTAAGDVISVSAGYGDLPATGEDLSLSFAAVAQSDIARIAAGVAEALDDDLRTKLVSRAANGNDLATAELRADVQVALIQVTGGTLSVYGGADPGNFRVAVETPAATSLTLTAIHSPTTVDDGTTRPSPGTVTATAIVNGWIVQLVDIDSTAPAGVLTDADIDEVLGAIEPLFQKWTNEPPTGTACGTYTIRAGDTLASIAEQHGVTLEALHAANADLDSGPLPGVVINVPCPDPNAAAPTNNPTEPIAATIEDEGLPFLVLDPPPAGYTFSSAINARYGKDYEPPALLLAWTDSEDAQIPVTVGADNHDEPIPAPAGADLVATGTVTGWVWSTDGITSAYLQPTDGPTYRLYSSHDDVPGDVLVDIVTALTPDGTLTWHGQLPNGVVELARQDRDTSMHAATYESADGAVTISTYSDLPVNGLTLNPGATVTPDLSILGTNGFALANPGGDGATEQVLYWSTGDGPVFSISATGTNIDVEELITIAGQTRPASPEEETEFQQR